MDRGIVGLGGEFVSRCSSVKRGQYNEAEGTYRVMIELSFEVFPLPPAPCPAFEYHRHF